MRPNGGHLVALIWTMKYIYGMHPGEVSPLFGLPFIIFPELLLQFTSDIILGLICSVQESGNFPVDRELFPRNAKLFLLFLLFLSIDFSLLFDASLQNTILAVCLVSMCIRRGGLLLILDGLSAIRTSFTLR